MKITITVEEAQEAIFDWLNSQLVPGIRYIAKEDIEPIVIERSGHDPIFAGFSIDMNPPE